MIGITLEEVGPRFDESLGTVARGLHLGDVTLAALVAAAILFGWLERRGRGKWAQVPLASMVAGDGPYRESSIVSARLKRAPRLVRAASFASFALAHLFAPLIILSLTRYPFDGIAIPLIPGIALILANWGCGWRLLVRSPGASAAALSGAKASLIANVGLLVLAGAHFAVVEAQRREGIQHACSTSVTFVVIVFAVASLGQALLTLTALRAHEAELDWARK
jgi:hypothetical protein